MRSKYVLDACALLALVYREDGFSVIKSILKQADSGDTEVFMNKLNLLEVYYNLSRDRGIERAEHFYNEILNSPVVIIEGISDDVFREAGRLKATYRISIADSIALAEASVSGGSLLTSDHHEFDAVEKSESIKFHWIR